MLKKYAEMSVFNRDIAAPKTLLKRGESILLHHKSLT